MFYLRKRVIFVIVLFIYFFLFILLIFYWMYEEKLVSYTGMPLKEKRIIEEEQIQMPQFSKKIHIEIWGKASISLYLWKHILKGPVESLNNGFMNVGNLTLNNFEFSFRNGPGFIQTTVPQNVKYLVLVLNGRSTEKVKQAEQWLVYLRKLKHLKKVCVVLLGSEQCENNWILPHMKSTGGCVDVAFLVYDSPLIDDKEFFQWPLGVAEYRGFPDFTNLSANLLDKRPYVANFVGTVYKNSSRESLVSLIEKRKWTDKVRLVKRNDWIPNETTETMRRYVETVQLSDLTLSPVGMNTECYRIYEALSLGSVPVVEDVVTPGGCDRRSPAPLRLLKHLQAPVLWLSNWTELAHILENEQTMTFRQITVRRIQAVKWYKNFKDKMKLKFLEVLKNKFYT